LAILRCEDRNSALKSQFAGTYGNLVVKALFCDSDHIAKATPALFCWRCGTPECKPIQPEKA
jgi:hypothetical protein